MSTDLADWTAHIHRKSWFFGIGINNYLHYPPLNNAVKDVQDLQRLMVERYDVEPEHIVTLFNEDANETNIISTLEQLTAKVSPEDKLLIYYSGHGIVNPHTQLVYWIPVQGRPGDSAGLIGNSTIHDHLSVINAKHILLISDSCYSGSIFIPGRSRSAGVIESMETTASRWALCSGRSDEVVYDGDPGTNSPFAKSLLDTLSGNTSDTIHISHVIDRVRAQTAAQSDQIPEGNPLRVKGHQGGQYVFRIKGTASASSSLRTHQKPVISMTQEEAVHRPEDTRASVTDTIEKHQSQGKEANWRMQDGKLSWNSSKESSEMQTVSRTVSMQLAPGESKKLLRKVLLALGAIALVVAIAIIAISRSGDSGSSGPLSVSSEITSNGILVELSGGQPVYYVGILSSDELIFGDSTVQTGEISLPFETFDAFPGKYTLAIQDGSATTRSVEFEIPQPEGIAVSAFHTTTGINSATLWPADQATTFRTKQPVYVYANLMVTETQDVVFNWFDENGNLLFAPEVRGAEEEPGDATRLVTYRQFPKPGRYLVEITDRHGIILQRTQFEVIEQEE